MKEGLQNALSASLKLDQLLIYSTSVPFFLSLQTRSNSFCLGKLLPLMCYTGMLSPIGYFFDTKTIKKGRKCVSFGNSQAKIKDLVFASTCT